MGPLVVPALMIDRIDANQLDFPALDPVGQRSHQTKIFVLSETSPRGGEKQNRSPRPPEPQELHRPVEEMAVPDLIVTLHAAIKSSVRWLGIEGRTISGLARRELLWR